MSEQTRILAWGIDLPEYKGKSYRLGEPTQGVKAEFEQYLKKAAMTACIEASQGLEDSEKRYNREIVLEDLRLGKFKWGGEKWKTSLGSEDGIAQMMLLLLEEGERTKTKNKHTPTRELVAEMMTDEELGPWLWGAVYYVSGIDPQLALAAGQMAIAGAKKAQAEAGEKVMAVLKTLQGS